MPEGDSLHRAAAAAAGSRRRARRGRDAASARGGEGARGAARRAAARAGGGGGKNLLLHFEGGLVLRSHLRMNGRWRVEPRGAVRRGKPWLVLRGAEHEAVLWNGPVLELARARRAAARPGHPRRAARLRDDARAAARRPTASARSATRCSTSGSSPGSGTSGRPRRSGRRASRRGGALAEVADDELPRRARGGARAMRTSSTGRAAAPRLPPRGPAVPALRRRRSARRRRASRPHRLLVSRAAR